MAKTDTTDKDLELLHDILLKLEKRVTKVKNNSAPTVPIYDVGP